jgi:hypothetical protein
LPRARRRAPPRNPGRCPGRRGPQPAGSGARRREREPALRWTLPSLGRSLPATPRDAPEMRRPRAPSRAASGTRSWSPSRGRRRCWRRGEIAQNRRLKLHTRRRPWPALAPRALGP